MKALDFVLGILQLGLMSALTTLLMTTLQTWSMEFAIKIFNGGRITWHTAKANLESLFTGKKVVVKFVEQNGMAAAA